MAARWVRLVKDDGKWRRRCLCRTAGSPSIFLLLLLLLLREGGETGDPRKVFEVSVAGVRAPFILSSSGTSTFLKLAGL